jgi:hypothetical protein
MLEAAGSRTHRLSVFHPLLLTACRRPATKRLLVCVGCNYRILVPLAQPHAGMPCRRFELDAALMKACSALGLGLTVRYSAVGLGLTVRYSAVGLGLTVRSAVGVGVNSALQCGWGRG